MPAQGFDRNLWCLVGLYLYFVVQHNPKWDELESELLSECRVHSVVLAMDLQTSTTYTGGISSMSMNLSPNFLKHLPCTSGNDWRFDNTKP